MEWKTCKISDLAVIISGGTPKTTIESFWNGNIPWLSVKDFSGDSKYVYTTEKTITDEGLKHSTANLLSAQDIVISARGTVGELAMLPFPMSLNQSCFGLRARCDADFLYYLLKVKVAEFKQRANGGVFGTIIRTTFDKVKCRIPDSLECQHRIASILSAYDNLIENNTKRIRLLEKMAENLYKEWFVRFRFPGYEKAEMENGLPKGWKVERYGEVAAIYAGGDKPKVYSKEISTECNIPIYSNGVENNGLYGFTNKATVKVSSITISARGTVGFVAIRRIPFVPIVRLLTVVPQKGLDVYYLYFASRNNDLEGNGTSQQQLTVPMLKKRKVVIPIKGLLREFGNRCSLFYNQIDNLQHQNTLLARQRDLLLPRLMSGKLEVKP